jgi:DNA-binding transcriptional MerR regulator
MALKIGELARLTQTNAPTIRYYEEIGLLPPARRRSSGQRCYGDADIKRLTLIRRCRAFGFPIKQVQSLLAISERSCSRSRPLAVQHLKGVRSKIVELRALERTLGTFLQRCDDTGPDCAALQDLTRTAGPSPRPER